MSISIIATSMVNRPVFVSILALTLAACTTREVNHRSREAASPASSSKANVGENLESSQLDAKGKKEKSFLALALPDSMPVDVTTVQVTLAKVEQPIPMSASAKGADALMLTGHAVERRKCGTLVETQRPKDYGVPPAPPSPPAVVVDPVPQPLPVPSTRPVPTLGDIRPVDFNPAIHPMVIVKCEPGTALTFCSGGPSILGRPERTPALQHGLHPLDGYYSSSNGWDSPLSSTDVWGTTSSPLNYSFPATDKEIKIDDLDVGTYQITIDLTDSDTGRVVEHGEGIVIVEPGKQAVAHIKMSPVPATTGSLLIILDRDPVALAAAK